MFLVRVTGATHAVRFTNDELYDFASVPGRKINGKAMQVSSRDLSANMTLCGEIYNACKEAFETHFAAYSFDPTDGWSIRSCATFTEDGLSPRAESFINHHYVSVFCDEAFAIKDKGYLVSVTPYSTTPDAFDYDEVEATPYAKHIWCDSEESATAAYKRYCMDLIDAMQ